MMNILLMISLSGIALTGVLIYGLENAQALLSRGMKYDTDRLASNHRHLMR